MVEVKRYKTWEETRVLHEAWNSLVMDGLNETTGIPSVFQTYEWHEAWWKAFGSRFELLVLAAFEDGVLRAVAPLMIRRKWLPVPSRSVHFIGALNFASDYCAFIVAQDCSQHIHQLLAWLDEHPELWNEIDFANLLDESYELRALKTHFGAARFHPVVRFLYDAPTRKLGNAEEDREAVNKKSLKRHFNYFKKQGELSFGELRTPAEIETRLDAFFEQHIARRGITRHPSPFLDPRQRDFYRQLVAIFLPRGWLRFTAVTLDGQPIAFHFGFELGRRYYWYKPSFDIRYLKKSPGEVLIKYLLEDCLARGLSEFDFTVGSEDFKYRFANRIRKVYRFHAFRTAPQYWGFKAYALLRGLRRRLLNRPARPDFPLPDLPDSGERP